MISGAASADALSASSLALRDVSDQSPISAAGISYRQFSVLVEALSALVRWNNAVRAAEVDSDRFLRAAKVAASDIAIETAKIEGAEGLARAASRISEVSEIGELCNVATLLLGIPLPLPIFVEIPLRTGPSHASTASRPRPEAIVAFTSFRVNGSEFRDPQTIQPKIIHDLAVDVSVSSWPSGAKELVLEPVSVEPATAYELPTFSFGRPQGEPPYSMNDTQRLVLQYPTAFFARPLQFSYRARFVPEAGGVSVVVQGHRHLRFQCFDLGRDPQSGYAQVDSATDGDSEYSPL